MWYAAKKYSSIVDTVYVQKEDFYLETAAVPDDIWQQMNATIF